MATFIALLRGINVGGNNKIPMVELRALCSELGFFAVQSYIQSGNLVFTATGQAAEVEARLEKGIAGRFGFSIDVIVRSAAQWPGYIKGNPLAEASQKEPNRVLLALSKSPPKAGAVAALRERAQTGERIEGDGEAVWIHFASGIGVSKLLPAVLDRALGSSVTTRNLRTVLKLAELAGVAV